MTASLSKEYREYATCHMCGLKKLCKLENGRFTCFSCSNGNFNGLKKIMKNMEKQI